MSKIPDTATRGWGKAATNAQAILGFDVDEILRDFEKFDTDEARDGFAIGWTWKVAQRLNETWPMLYRLLKHIMVDIRIIGNHAELLKKPRNEYLLWTDMEN